MHNYKKMKIWNEGISLSTIIYQNTKSFPTEELFGLSNQMRRSAVSIPSNIAEGSSRNSYKDFNHFLSIALGSCFELETQITISKNLFYIDDSVFSELSTKLILLQKKIYRFKKKLEKENSVQS